MKVLVTGAGGMLGHKALQVLSTRFETHGTVRRGREELARVAPDAAAVYDGVTAERVADVVRELRPDAVVNCIGIVKQLDEAKDPVVSIRVNSLFPHELRAVCAEVGARLIQISTDCVFSGRQGGYSEDDVPDPVDLYGRSKLLGEVAAPPALTIRTSIVGRELQGAHGLVEWFLGQEGGTVRGFRHAIFSGWTTTALASVLGDVIESHPQLTGLWHVAAEPIDKLTLLTLIRDELGLDVAIEPDDDFHCDRSLDGSRFRAETGIVAPSWPELVAGLRQEVPLYDDLRGRAVAHG